MKNVMKWQKDFLLYFTTLKSYREVLYFQRKLTIPQLNTKYLRSFVLRYNIYLHAFAMYHTTCNTYVQYIAIFLKWLNLKKFFTLAYLNLKKKVPNHSPDHLFFKWIVFMTVIWNFSWRFQLKWKSFWD